MTDVSIIIINYKTVPLIMNCLESIYANTTGISFEIIVVDNNSNDNFQVQISKKYPKVKCIPLPQNIGFGRANNEGLKIARGRNILFLNPDTLLINNAVKILSDYLDVHPKVGVCGGNLYDEEMRPTHSYRMMLPSIMWELNSLSHGLIDKLLFGKNALFNYTNKPKDVGYITGADMLVRRNILAYVGGFSPDFFMYYEETELTFRIKKAGYQIVSVPNAKIQHLEGKSMGGKSINPHRILYMETSCSLFHKKCSNTVQRKIVQILRLIRCFSSICCKRKRSSSLLLERIRIIIK